MVSNSEKIEAAMFENAAFHNEAGK